MIKLDYKKGRDKMSIRKKYLLQTILFVVIFTGLLLIATFFDLEISKILVHGSIPDGKFYSTDPIGRFVEYIGSYPIFLLGIFACLVFMHRIYRLEDKRKYLALIFVIAIVVVSNKCLSDTVKYFCRNHEIEHIYDATLTTIILLVLSVLVSVVMIYFYRKVDHNKNDKMIKLSLVIVITCIAYALIPIIKSPVGRMRYRAMELIDNFDYYTPWYVISEAKDLLKDMTQIPSDGFKSFPSGHTCSAGIIYALICMPYAFEKFNTKKWRVLWYVIPILFTGFVATYRIVVGAHFMSDVLVGGTLSYIFAELGKYFVFVKKNKEISR